MIKLLDEKRKAIISFSVTQGINNVKLKDSNIEGLGKIPINWMVKRLKYLATVKARLGWKGLKAEEYVYNGYIFLSTPNIKSDKIDFENVNYITKERYDESPEIMLQKGDVLIVKDGSTLGIINYIEELPSPATLNSSIAIIRANKELFYKYLYFSLLSNYNQNTIQRLKGGMGVPHLFQEDIREFVLLIPPIQEQQQIVRHIESETIKIDKTLSKIEKEIALLQEYKTALISEAVTGKIDVRKEGENA